MLEGGGSRGRYRLSAWVGHNLGLKILSLGLALVLWAVVLGEQKIEVTVPVPLPLEVPRGLVLVNDPPDSVEVHLRGPKTLVTSLAPREVNLPLLAGPFEEGENLIAFRLEMVQVPRGIQVMSVVPPRVRVVLESLQEREVDVIPRVEGSPPEGFVVKRVTSLPPRVHLAGPSGEVRRLVRVHTLPVDLTGHTTSFSARVLLEPMGRQVRIQDPDPITVEIEIGPRRAS
jgi:hypothetical protein